MDAEGRGDLPEGCPLAQERGTGSGGQTDPPRTGREGCEDVQVGAEKFSVKKEARGQAERKGGKI